MEQLRALITDMEKTSGILQEASEHMKRLENTVDFNTKRYKEILEIMHITHDRIKDDRILRLYFPELMEYMGGVKDDGVRRENSL